MLIDGADLLVVESTLKPKLNADSEPLMVFASSSKPFSQLRAVRCAGVPPGIVPLVRRSEGTACHARL